MRILVTGAYGFIGTQVVATLRSAQHTVVCGVRDMAQACKRFPDLELIACNFEKDVNTKIWQKRLKNIDAVVNCVGILYSRDPKVITAVHYHAPRALFEACCNQNIKIIHISALGADEGVGTLYAQTKFSLEKYMQTLQANWVILRPSLVYGSGSFGGTSLFRALAALPFFIPVVGDGKQTFQPVHISDVAKTVEIVVRSVGISRKTINVVGGDKVSLEQILCQLRNWLGFGKTKILHIPLALIKPIAYLGNWIQDIPINMTSYKMLSYSNTADYESFIKIVEIKPRKFIDSLIENPSSLQDRWHARLYFLNPLLRLTLGLLWVLSGFIPLCISDHQESFNLLQKCGLNGIWVKLIFYGNTLLDIALGIATLMKWKIKWIGGFQFLLISFYTIFISVLLPGYWTDPLGAVVKNIPILIATLIMLVLSESR